MNLRKWISRFFSESPSFPPPPLISYYIVIYVLKGRKKKSRKRWWYAGEYKGEPVWTIDQDAAKKFDEHSEHGEIMFIVKDLYARTPDALEVGYVKLRYQERTWK